MLLESIVLLLKEVTNWSSVCWKWIDYCGSIVSATMKNTRHLFCCWWSFFSIQMCIISQDLHFIGGNLFHLHIWSKEPPHVEVRSCTVEALLEPKCFLMEKSDVLRFYKPPLNSSVSTSDGFKCIEIKNLVDQLYTPVVHTHTYTHRHGLHLCREAGSKSFPGRVVRKDLVARCSVVPPQEIQHVVTWMALSAALWILAGLYISAPSPRSPVTLCTWSFFYTILSLKTYDTLT